MSIVRDSTDEDKDEREPPEDGKDVAAVALGRKGRLKGGKSRADKLSRSSGRRSLGRPRDVDGELTELVRKILRTDGT